MICGFLFPIEISPPMYLCWFFFWVSKIKVLIFNVLEGNLVLKDSALLKTKISLPELLFLDESRIPLPKTPQIFLITKKCQKASGAQFETRWIIGFILYPSPLKCNGFCVRQCSSYGEGLLHISCGALTTRVKPLG